jgi:hypothetical protein
MNLKARILRLEKLQNPHSDGKITIDVFDRIVNDTISDKEFLRWEPYLEEIFADRETTCETQ